MPLDDSPAKWTGASLSGAAESPMVELLRILAAIKGTPSASPETSVQGPERQLHTFTYSHECALLREPWPSRATTPSGQPVYARPCLFGPDCQGMTADLPGHAECGGVVLCEAMTPDELAAFEERGLHPAQRRGCILCLRFFMMEAFLCLNKSAASPERVLLNDLYQNPVDCEDGYGSCACLPAAGTENSWCGIHGHVVMYATNKLRLRQEEATKLWRVDQSAIRASEGTSA